MADSFSVPLSGALAQAQRLANSAQNVANARTAGALPPRPGAAPPPPPAGADGGPPEPFRPLEPGQEALAGPDGRGQGTRAVFRPSSPGFVPEFAPDSPFADADGLVAAPDVDPLRETVERMSALRGYQLNLAALRTADEMEREVLDLKA
ncbi:MAG TPA: flagellar basal body rod C-terminal domain-containing protein [Azospirillaceae bacterium]|nr:flagellar basal body rod C-terminal domain-containing protein [Azospirillaceae bacterium]